MSDFATSMQDAVNRKFRGVHAETHYNILAMAYVTTWKTKSRKKNKQIKLFVEAYEAGYLARGGE